MYLSNSLRINGLCGTLFVYEVISPWAQAVFTAARIALRRYP